MRIGLIGLGYLGKIHLKCLKQTDFELVGLFDIDNKICQSLAQSSGVPAFQNLEDLFSVCDAVAVISSTDSHFSIVKQALAADLHVFVEKPLTAELDQAYELRALKANKPALKLQVGHIERYNPALLSLDDFKLSPQFMEIHRLSPYNIRGTEVSVVMDLMIHDLDVLIKLIDDKLIDVQAKGVKLFSNTHDICNARLTFKRGCVVNITASRISLKSMRKMRVFQSDAYVNIDFLERKSQIIQLSDKNLPDELSMPIETASGMKHMSIKTNKPDNQNSIVLELQDFYDSIVNNTSESVGIDDAVKAIELAHQIEETLKINE